MRQWTLFYRIALILMSALTFAGCGGGGSSPPAITPGRVSGSLNGKSFSATAANAALFTNAYDRADNLSVLSAVMQANLSSSVPNTTIQVNAAEPKTLPETQQPGTNIFYPTHIIVNTNGKTYNAKPDGNSQVTITGYTPATRSTRAGSAGRIQGSFKAILVADDGSTITIDSAAFDYPLQNPASYAYNVPVDKNGNSQGPGTSGTPIVLAGQDAGGSGTSPYGPYSVIELPTSTQGVLPITMRGAGKNYALLSNTAANGVTSYYRWDVTSGTIDLLNPLLSVPHLDQATFSSYQALGINADGTVVGYSNFTGPIASGVTTIDQACMWKDLKVSLLDDDSDISGLSGVPFLAAGAYDITDGGMAFGVVGGRANEWSGAKVGPSPLNLPNGGDGSFLGVALLANNTGDAVIATITSTGQASYYQGPFSFYADNSLTPMGLGADSTMKSISREARVVAGYTGLFVSAQAFIWNKGQLSVPPPLTAGDVTRANAVSDDGTQVVGSSGNGGVIWDPYGVYDLNKAIQQVNGKKYVIGETFGMSRANDILALATVLDTAAGTARITPVVLVRPAGSRVARPAQQITPEERKRGLALMQQYIQVHTPRQSAGHGRLSSAAGTAAMTPTTKR